MERILEPEVMDTWEDAIEYDSMDFREVNTAFAEAAIAVGPPSGLILDAGTGTARIPIEIARKRPQWQIIAVDLSANMLKVGDRNVREAGLENRIQLDFIDAKKMPYPNGHFDAIISNSIVHHLPDPIPFFDELKRLLKPNGGLFLRDLMRPDDRATVDALVAAIGSEYNDYQTKLFRDSLHAAFTVAEIREMLDTAGLKGVKVYQSSDRHWTAERQWGSSSGGNYNNEWN